MGGLSLPLPMEDEGREWSDEGPTFLLFLPLAQAFFGGGANLMISSSEGCRIMSGGGKRVCPGMEADSVNIAASPRIQITRITNERGQDSSCGWLLTFVFLGTGDTG